MTRRKHTKWFDPRAALGELIKAIEKMPDMQPEPAAGFAAIALRVDAATAEFRRGLERLHRAEGDSSGLEILLEDFERVCRRAARIGADAEGGA